MSRNTLRRGCARRVRSIPWSLPLFGVLLVSACSDDSAPVASTATPTATVAVATVTPTSPLTPTTVERTPSPTSTPTAAPETFRVTGNVGSLSFCNGAGSEIRVVLEPSARSTVTDTRGDFAFENVADGVYELRIGSEPFVQPLTIAGGDERVSFCLACPDTLAIEPRSGPAGTTVSVSGAGCYALHSGRAAQIRFDDIAVANTHGSQIGDYHTSFVVPHDAAAGPHMVRLFGSPGEVGDDGEMASAQFVVEPGR